MARLVEVEHLQLEEKVTAQKASRIPAPGWLYLLALEEPQASTVGGTLTERDNSMPVIDKEKGGVVCVCSTSVPCE